MAKNWCFVGQARTATMIMMRMARCRWRRRPPRRAWMAPQKMSLTSLELRSTTTESRSIHGRDTSNYDDVMVVGRSTVANLTFISSLSPISSLPFSLSLPVDWIDTPAFTFLYVRSCITLLNEPRIPLLSCVAHFFLVTRSQRVTPVSHSWTTSPGSAFRDQLTGFRRYMGCKNQCPPGIDGQLFKTNFRTYLVDHISTVRPRSTNTMRR